MLGSWHLTFKSGKSHKHTATARSQPWSPAGAHSCLPLHPVLLKTRDGRA